MNKLRETYDGVSFRGRLLMLLVAVSLVQAMVAAFTFQSLQTKPVEQRVRAQLDASLRGIAPVVDNELDDAARRLRDLTSNQELLTAIETGDEIAVSQTLEADNAVAEAESAAEAAASGTAEPGEPADVPRAYITDAEDNVIAGVKPDGAAIEKNNVTNTPVRRGQEYLGEIHVPVVLDEKFMDGVERYVPQKAGVTVFVMTDEQLITKKKTYDRPRGLNGGYDLTEFGGDEYQVETREVLDGSVLIGAGIPTSVVAADRRESLSKLIGFVFALLAIMIVVSVVVTRSVGDALRKFAQMAQRLAGGDLSKRIEVIGDDEVAVLSTSFNDMAANLEERIDSLIEARAAMRRQVELFGDALANATEVGEMLNAVCGLALESTVATHARFWTIDDDGRYQHSACIGLRPGDREPCSLEKSVAVRNAAVRSQSDPWWLVVPARSGDTIVGLLTLVSKGEQFTDDDVRMAGRIAVQAAVAIDNARMHERLREQATRDGLTGLPNHRSLQDALAAMLEDAERTAQPLGVALLDIDNFKRINDTYGHPVGDEAIKALGAVLAHGIGDFGMVGRYGGEEFVVLMPGVDAAAGARVADRLREDITHIEVPLEDGSMLTFTASFGVTNLDLQTGPVDNAELFHQADVGLYNAKRSGKNQVQIAGPDTQAIEMTADEQARLQARERGESAAA